MTDCFGQPLGTVYDENGDVVQIGDGVITTDARGEIVLINRTAETITRWSSADAVGCRLDRVLQLHEPAPASEVGERLVLPGPDQPDIFETIRSADLVTRRN